MGGDKTFVFGNPAENGGGSGKIDIMAMLPGLFGGGKNSLDPNLVAALMNGKNNQDGWGGAGCWWIWIILLFFCWGWGGNGFGGFGGNRGGGMQGLPNELNNDTGRELLMQAINGNGNAINQLASSLNCSTQQLQGAICNLQGGIDRIAGQVGMSSQQVINAIERQSCEIGRQISDCCCTTQNAITRMGYENQLANCNQTNTLVNTMNGNTLSLRDANLANTQAIIAKLDAAEARHNQEKIDTLTSQNLALQGQISQANQNQYFAATVQAATAPIVNRLNALQGDVDGIKCKLPPTVAVPYPQLQAFNPECFRAAAYGAAAGTFAADAYAGYGPYNNCGC